MKVFDKSGDGEIEYADFRNWFKAGQPQLFKNDDATIDNAHAKAK